jgi:endonuclease YncB( thermonuclease family)
LANPALAEMTSGPEIVDGDTMEIQHQRTHLFVSDSPDGRQRFNLNGKSWRCGQQARFALD